MNAPPFDITAAVVAVNQALSNPAARNKYTGEISIPLTAELLGWPQKQLREFLDLYGALVNYQQSMVSVAEPPVLPPTEVTLIHESIPEDKPNDTDLAVMVQRAEEQLGPALKLIGFSDEDAAMGEAMAKYNGKHFINSSHIISTSVMKHLFQLYKESEIVKSRLEEVRLTLAMLPPDVALSVREYHLKEEAGLMDQMLRIAEAISGGQANWYRGACQIALMKAKLEGDVKNNAAHNPFARTQRNNRPGFGSTFVASSPGPEDP